MKCRIEKIENITVVHDDKQITKIKFYKDEIRSDFHGQGLLPEKKIM